MASNQFVDNAVANIVEEYNERNVIKFDQEIIANIKKLAYDYYYNPFYGYVDDNNNPKPNLDQSTFEEAIKNLPDDNINVYFPFICKLDANLKKKFINQATSNDGNCLFHALSYGLSKVNPPIFKTFIDLRNEICNYLCDQDIKNDILVRNFVFNEGEREFDGTDSDEYICRMRKPGTYGGAPEIEAAIKLYKVNIKVYDYRSSEEVPIGGGTLLNIYSSDRTINISNCSSVANSEPRHYEYLEPINQHGGSIKNLAKLYDSRQNLGFGLKNLAKLI